MGESPRRRAAIDTHDEILPGAVGLFQQRRYRRATFDDIARDLGLSRSAVVWHFRRKPELLDALVSPVLDEYPTPLDGLDPADPNPPSPSGPDPCAGTGDFLSQWHACE